MTDRTYNGWTNYATWRVNLEIFDDTDPDGFDLTQDAYDLGIDLRNYAESIIDDTTDEGIGRDYALAFIQDVNWWEIASHMIDAHAPVEETDE